MNEFPVETLNPEPFAFIKRKAAMAEMPKVMGEGFAELGARFGKAKAAMAGEPLAHYLDYDDNSATFEIGFPVRPEDVEALRAAGLGIGETPGGTAMRATHIGPYDTVVTTYNAMTDAMKSQGLAGTKDMWERYFSPPGTPPEQIRTEVIWPVRKAA